MVDSFLLCTFCSAITYGDVNYDYMPETFASSKKTKQINNFACDEENIFKKKAGRVKQGRTYAYFLYYKNSDTFR